MLTSQAYEKFDISSSSSYSTFTEEFEPTDDFIIKNNMPSPYSGHGDCMDFLGNENILHEG